jgi:hypothetical protein
MSGTGFTSEQKSAALRVVIARETVALRKLSGDEHYAKRAHIEVLEAILVDYQGESRVRGRDD